MAGQQHPPQRARLYTVAVHLSGLLGALALDLGATRVGHAYAAEAFDLAEAAQQPEVRATLIALRRKHHTLSMDDRATTELRDDASGVGGAE